MTSNSVKVTICPKAYNNGYLAYMNKNGLLETLSHIEGFVTAARGVDRSKIKRRKRR